MIEKALAYFLRNTNSGTTTNAVRQTARRKLREAVGRHIYSARRPQVAGQANVALSLRRISSIRFNDLPGEDKLAAPIIQGTIWTRGPNAEMDALRTSDWLRQSLSGYWGSMGEDDTYVHGCIILRDSMETPVEPKDKSPDWTYAVSMDFEITHAQTSP